MSANPIPFPPTRPEEYPPTGGDHFWAKASRDLRRMLSDAIPHEVLKELHRKDPRRHFAIAIRQFLLLAAASAIAWLFRQPGSDPGALVSGFTASTSPFCFTSRAPDRLGRPQSARGTSARDPLRRPLRNLRPPVHPLAPDSPRGARGLRGGSQAALPFSQNQPPLVQAPLLHARAFPDLFQGRAARDGDLPASAPEENRARADADDPPPCDHGAPLAWDDSAIWRASSRPYSCFPDALA